MPTPVYGETNTASGGSGGTSSGIVVGPFAQSNSASGTPGLGGFSGFAYPAITSGSIIGATATIGSGQNGTTTIAIYKNGTSLVTAFSNVSFTNTANRMLTVQFPSGTYNFVANDYLTFIVTAQSTAFTLAANLVLTAY